MKRLKSSGGMVENTPHESDSDDKIVRSAILVHAGDSGKSVTFMSGDGKISFDAERIKHVVDVHNKKVDELSDAYGGEDKIPIGAYPPILDQHENDSNNRIVGRLTGRLKYDLRDVPKVGKGVPCAVANGITFLGKETVERVKDGRIYHLSIGIDEEGDTLGELSTVIEPAAPGAMLLSRGGKNNLKGESKVMIKKQLKAKVDRLSKLSEMKNVLEAAKTKLTATANTMKLTKKTGEITHRLTGIMSSGKLTPAEYKKLDLTKLAKMESEALDMVFGAYENREQRVIEPGQRGSVDAIDAVTLTRDMKKTDLKRLRSETVKDIKRLSGKALKGLEHYEDKEHGDTHEMSESINPGKDPHAVPGEGGDAPEGHMAKHLELMGHHLAKGDLEAAKAVHAEMMKAHHAKHMAAPIAGDVKSEDYQKSMTDLQSQVDEIHTQMARMAGMVSELMDVEKEEGHELEAGEHDEEKPVEKK